METSTRPLGVTEKELSTAIGDFKKYKQTELTTLKANPRQIEGWINDVLRDAHYLEIPGSIAIKDAASPL